MNEAPCGFSTCVSLETGRYRPVAGVEITQVPQPTRKPGTRSCCCERKSSTKDKNWLDFKILTPTLYKGFGNSKKSTEEHFTSNIS